MADGLGAAPKYSRVLLKLSGEAFVDPQHGFGIDPRIVGSIARQISEAKNIGTQLSLVIGGGNIIRGLSASAQGTDRTTADYMGMLSTVINALAMQDALEREGVETRVQTAIWMQELAEPYIRRRALRHLEKGRGSSCRGHRESLFLHRYDRGAASLGDRGRSHPEGDPSMACTLGPGHECRRQVVFLGAVIDVLKLGLKVMDSTAISLCMDNRLPIIVFNMKAGNIARVLNGEEVGTLVRTGWDRLGGTMADDKDGVLREAEDKMHKAVSVNREELASIRSGRASPSLLNRINVDYYGTPTPLNQIANLSVPEPRLLVISPYDRRTS